MIEQEIEISAPDGTIDGLLLRPESSGTWPGVIQLTDIGGMRPAAHQVAQQLAARGYVVLVPNAFYRTGRPPLFTFKPDFSDPKTLKRFSELAAPLTPEAIERDASYYIDFLASQPWVKPGKLGVVGYCITGGAALRIAAARPESIAAAASFHGGGLCTDAPTSPHLVLPRIKSRLYFGHAVKDRNMSEQAIQKLDAALAAWGGKYESVVYEGALHGWTMPDPGSAVYNPAAADKAFQALDRLFAEELR